MTGTVYLVGSGPGDPDLLTVKARRILDTVDVVLHDNLVSPAVLDTIPSHRCIDVGTSPSGSRTTQTAINEKLVKLATADKDVVRLKGGDPFVFGRGGEEAEYLARHEIPFEYVPGITSAVSAPGIAGIPITHRACASNVTIVTGHEDPSKPESTVDWESIAATGGTIVVLMGVSKLPAYTEALLKSGMDPTTPAALIERATWDAEHIAVGTLETLVSVRDQAGIDPPAVTVIGEVAAHAESVHPFLTSSTATPEVIGWVQQ